MKKIIKPIAFVFTLSLGILLLQAYRPIRNFLRKPEPYKGIITNHSSIAEVDPGKKTVCILADPKLTEPFDLLAPFYLFNATGKANVYIVAKEKTPVWLRTDLYVLPQLSFREYDSMRLTADLIVIPALSCRDEHQDPVILNWIKSHFHPDTKMLTICDGAATGAATGLYDGKALTCHATDFETIKAPFPKAGWVQHQSATKDGNLFSTAGVANAVEGSLLVIGELFGTETTKQLAAWIHYPHDAPKLTHQSIALNQDNLIALFKKILFKENKKIGVQLNDGIEEFGLAAFLDIYNRSFPAAFKVYGAGSRIVRTKYGLVLICTGDQQTRDLDELHMIGSSTEGKDAKENSGIGAVIVHNPQEQYPLEDCVNRIGEQYGPGFESFVKISLDYN
jgi:putative intracellular protease/amidase